MLEKQREYDYDTEILDYTDWNEEEVWNVIMFLDECNVALFEKNLSRISAAIITDKIEKGKNNGRWSLKAICSPKPDENEIEKILSSSAKEANIKTPEFSLEKIEPTNWLLECKTNFPPINVGRFYIRGSHVTEEPPKNKIELMLDAATAFGSGEHFTTKGCLMAIDDFADYKFGNKNPISALDMGCGSGILAMAIAKLFPECKTFAADIDEEAVRVTNYNIKNNNVDDFITAEVSNGYDGDFIKENAPFDLIVANILANPLIQMAPDLKNNLTENGIAVLSGILTTQEQMVLDAHINQGFKLLKAYRLDEWSALVIANG